MGAFDDLIPANLSSLGVFDDLIPSSSPSPTPAVAVGGGEADGFLAKINRLLAAGEVPESPSRLGLEAATALPEAESLGPQVGGLAEAVKQAVLPMGTVEDPNVEYPQGGWPAQMEQTFWPQQQVEQAVSDIEQDPTSRESFKDYGTAAIMAAPFVPHGLRSVKSLTQRIVGPPKVPPAAVPPVPPVGAPPVPPVAPPVAPPVPPLIGPPMLPWDPLNPVRGSGKFRRTYQIDKELGDMMEGVGASKESGSLKGEIATRNLLSDLTPTQESELGQYLVSRRLSTLNPTHPQVLPPAEMLRIESDPAIARALDHYRNNIKPDIEALRLRAGLSAQAAAGQAPEFISLIPTNRIVPKGGPATQASRISRTTRFAQQAKGQGLLYSTDARAIINASYSEVMRKARLRDFYDAAHRKGLLDPNANPTRFVGREDFGDLPLELQDQLRAATERQVQPSGLSAVVRAIQKFQTGIALSANPAELLNHMRRQLNLVAAKPPVGRGVSARLEAVVPYIGPKFGAFMRTVTDNMSLPENQAILQDIFDAGGGSSRSFSGMYETKIPVLKQIQHVTHNLLFGVPKGRGIGGWDLRMRVQLEKIRRAAEGNRDPQRIREFANQIGQYGSHPDWFIKGLRVLNPYAATTLPMRLTELKTAVGTSGLKASALGHLGRQAETFLRGTGGTLLGLSAANYLLSGKWPWENDAGHEFDLNTGKQSPDGKQLYVKFRVLAPELSRPINAAGIPNLLRERTAEQPQYASAFLTGLANQGLSIASGPAQNALLTATTGKVPYITKAPGASPELMDIVKTTPEQSRGVEQLKHAAAEMNPLGRMFMEEPYKAETTDPILQHLESPLVDIPYVGKGVRPFGTMFSQSYEAKAPHQRTVGQMIRARKAAATLKRHRLRLRGD